MPIRSRFSAPWRFVVFTTAVLAAPSVSLAAEGAPYPGDLGQAVATLLIFLLLLLILRKYAWLPILTQLRRREDDISLRIEDAEKRQTQADELVCEYRRKMDLVGEKIEEMLSQARKESEVQRDAVLAAARVEAQQAAQRAQEEIDRAVQSAQRELQANTAHLAADLAEQFLTRSLTDADYDRLFEESARQIAGQDHSETA